MKQSNAIAYLRQLCCLGLDKEMVIAEFLRAVQMVIPSGGNVFTGCDAQFNPTFAVLERTTPELDAMIPAIMPVFFNRERRYRMAVWFKRHLISRDAALLDEKFYHSDFYNLVWRPNEQHHFVQSPIFVHDRIIGMLCLFRPRSQKPFTAREQSLLLQLTPYVAHAAQTPKETDIPYSGAELTGLLVMDTQGRIIYLSETAKNLLALARHPLVFADWRTKEAMPLPPLTPVGQNLVAIFQGKNAAPPSWSHTNSCGRFIFRAYWLDKQNREPGGLIGMTIEHQEPLVLKLVRAMRTLPLSPTQKEVALLLAQGLSSENIGRRLHIKLTTVNDHVRKIFTKLDIHHREELLPKLLGPDKSAPQSDGTIFKGN